MIDSFCTTGLVATQPSHSVLGDGAAMISFRLASTPRKFNRQTKAWEYAETNWFTVTAFRHLALNMIESVKKGDRVIVMGRMRIRDWSSKERSGTTVEITADSVGHDLTWGTAVYSRAFKSAPVGAVADGQGPTVPFDPDERAAVGATATGWADAEVGAEHSADGIGFDSVDELSDDAVDDSAADERAAVLVGE